MRPALLPLPAPPGLEQGELGPGNNWANWTGTPTSWTVVPGFNYSNVHTSNGAFPWTSQTTWVYSGQFYFPGNGNNNDISFYWSIDNGGQLKIDGSLWQGVQPQWSPGVVTGSLTPGWHSIEFRGSNNGGDGGAAGNNGIGFGWDLSGSNNINNIVAVPNDSGDGSLFQAGLSNALPATTALTIGTGATLNLNGVGATVGSLTGAAGSSVVGGNLSALTFGGDNTSTTFSGQLSGAIALGKLGTGTFTLSGDNTGYSGSVTISAGAIQLNNANSLGNGTAAVTVNATDQGLLFGPTVLAANLQSLSGTGNIALTNAANLGVTLNLNAGSTFSGVLSGLGSVSANLNGGLLALSAVNTYSGPTSIAGGVFQANDGGGLPAASALSLNNAILQSDGPAVFSRTVGTNFSMTGASGFAAKGGHFTVTLNPDPGTGVGATLVSGVDFGTLAYPTLTFGAATANNVVELTNNIDLAGQVVPVQVTAGTGGDAALLSGNIGDSTATTAALVKTGNGTLQLSGNNTYAGGTTVSTGTLAVLGAGALGTGTVQVDANATLAIPLPAYTFTNTTALSGDAGSVLQLGNATTGLPTAVTFGGSGTSNSFAGNITDLSGTTAGASGSVVKAGSGTLTLSGNSTFTGGVTIQSGTVAAGSSTALGTGPVTFAANGTTLQAAVNNVNVGSLVVNPNVTGTVDTNGYAMSVGSPIVGPASSVLNPIGNGTLTLNGNSANFAGTLTVNAGATVAGGSSSTGNTFGTGLVQMNGGTLIVAPGGTPPVTSGLVGLWKLTEGSGSTAFDTSGIATPTNGVLGSGNASWVSVPNAGTAGVTPFATAVQINGNSPGVTMGALSAFGASTSTQFNSARTISGWVELAAPQQPGRLARHVRVHRRGGPRRHVLRPGVG